MSAQHAISAAFAHHQAGNLNAAEAGYRNVLSDEPANLNGLQLLGVLLHQRGRSTEAVELLTAAAAALERGGGPRPDCAILHNNLGNALRAVGRVTEAAAQYREGIALDPKLAELRVNLGHALLVLGAYEQAVESYAHAFRLGPQTADCLDRLADAGAALGWIGAEEANDRSADDSAAVDPETIRIRKWMGAVAMLKADGQRAAAASACRSAVWSAPADFCIRLHLADLLIKAGAPADAVAVCQTVIAAAPANVTAHRLLGEAFAALGDTASAIETLRRCLLLDPRDGIACRELGMLLVRLGLHDPAVQLFEMAIAIGPGDAKSHAALGNLLQARGEVSRARACFVRSCEIEPLTSWPGAGDRERFSVLLLQAPGIANTPPDFLFGNSPFGRHVFALMPEIEPDLEQLRRKGDIVVNLISDADQGQPVLEAASRLVERLGKPIINHPRHVSATARDRLAACLPRSEHFLVPPTRRIVRGALAAPDGVAQLGRDGFSMPLLVRVVGTHGGDAFEKVETADDVASFLATYAGEEFYVTPYVDYRSGDGLFRKYRFVFTDQEILPYHLAIGERWKVHHYTTDMAQHAWMQVEEQVFLENPHHVFSQTHYEALASLRAAIGLEFFGIDCALDGHDNIVVFEVNASILIHDDNAEFPYKTPHCLRIKRAFEAMLERKAQGA